MLIETALRIAKDAAAARKRWGKQASLPYTHDQLLDAILVLDSAGRFDADESAEELTRTKRQLAAALAREAARKKRSDEGEQP